MTEAAGAGTRELTFNGIGTQWKLESSSVFLPSLAVRVADTVESFDVAFSRFRSDSLVTLMAESAGGGFFEFPHYADRLFSLFDLLANATGGAVDPLVALDLEDLGYDRDYRLIPSPGPRRRQSTDVWPGPIERAGTVLRANGRALIDVGAAGKGLLVDLIADVLIEAGHDSFVVDGSGDLIVFGNESVRVGLQDPRNPRRVIGVANLVDAALCASGTDKRVWGDGLHHVLDGRTGLPTRETVATWTVAQSAMLADGAATAAFFLNPEKLHDAVGCTSVRLMADGTVQWHPKFPGEIFLS